MALESGPDESEARSPMKGSLNEYLRLAAPYLQPELISPQALDHITRIGRFLPHLSASGFECRLGETDPGADLGIRFWPPERGPEYLAGLNVRPHDNLPAFLSQAEPWQRIQAFAARWAQPGTLLHREIEDIFLEFDVDGVPPEVPIPAFFLDFRKQAEHRIPTLREALTLLWGQALTPEVERQLMRCLELLPDGAVLYSVGAMFSRGLQGVRLYFHHMRSDEIPGYLARAGWRGSIAAITELLDWMPPGLTLCVDVGQQLLPKVGVQYHVEDTMRDGKIRWLDFLDLLVDRGLCLPGKRTALAVWIGHMHERSHSDVWPTNLRLLTERLGRRALSVFLRTLNHVKVSYEPDRPLEAKAYLGMVQTWLRYHPATRRYALGDLPPDMVHGLANDA